MENTALLISQARGAQATDPAEALLALYAQPPLDALKAPAFGTPDGPTVVGATLLDPAVLEERLARFIATFGDGADRKAAVSLWSKYHFATLSIPALVANLLLEIELPVALGEVRLAPGDNGATGRLWLAHGGRPLGSLAPEARFAGLFDDHCAPLIEALAGRSGLSPRVFWSNLGHYVEYAGRTCSSHPAFAGAGDPLLRFLDLRTLPDGRRNPLFQPVRYLEVGGQTPARVRRLCCVKYRMPGEPLCGGCPLKPENRPTRARR